MRCKKHTTDLSSAVGVCASCLRARLFCLVEEQQQHPEAPIRFCPNFDNPNPNPNCNRRAQKQPPPPLIFPRSVSPYISRRKSEPVPRFYPTPQVNLIPPKSNPNSASKSKFGLISRLFRSRSTKSSSTTTTTNSTTLTSHNSTVIACRNKGMSPENEFEDEYEEKEASSWMTRPSPARTRPSPARTRPSPARSASLAFCLSPLVRASPSRHRRGEKSGFSSEIRVTASTESSSNKPHLSAAASFCGNRSRKLADFGRLNHNR